MTLFTLPRLLHLVLCLLCLVCACDRSRDEPRLHVVAHAPSAPTDDAKAPVRISFDRPVVMPGEVGNALRELPVVVTPKVALSGHWVDRQTLVITPTTRWTPGTRYQVKLSGTLAERLADSFGFSFDHDPLDVVSVAGVDRRWSPVKPEFRLQFDQKVKARDVLEHCRFEGKEPAVRIELTTQDSARVDKEIPLALKSALTQGKSYTLKCDKLAPAEGSAGLTKPYEVLFEAYPKLSLVSSTPAPGSSATPDDLTLSLTFSTPIDRAELRKHVRITPRHPALKREWLARSDTVNEITASFEAETDYTLEIDESLTDRFGQKLGKAQRIGFTTSNAAPSLSVTKGIYAIEAEGAGYPVWTRNVQEFSVECAYVPKANLAKVLSANVDFYLWYDAEDPHKLDFKKLGLKPKLSQVSTGNRKNKWVKTPVSFPAQCGGPGRGVYLAELRSPAVEARRKEHGGEYPYRVMGNITDLGVLLKAGASSGLVWVSSLKTGTPVEAANITIYDASGRRAFSGTSDARGLLLLPSSDKLLPPKKGTADEEYENYGRQRLIAVVEKGDDLAVVDGHWSDGIQAWNFNLSSDYSTSEVALRGFIETDRGIYRPGETVHVKGLAREVPSAGEPRVPSEKQVDVHVEDGNGAAVLDQRVSLTEFGGFSFDAPLDAEARTGDYYITAKLGKTSFRQSFSVEEIRPVSFEITAKELKENVSLGSEIHAAIEARYLFGAPVTEGAVRYEVQRRRHWQYFSEFSDYSFEDWSDDVWTPWWEPETNTGFVSEGEGKTDQDGRFAFKFTDDVKGVEGPQDYLISASVSDAADQQVTKRLSVTGHPSEFYLGVALDSWVATAGTPFKVRAVALDIAGKQIAAQAKLTLSRVETRCGQEHESPYGYWHCERKLLPVLSKQIKLGAAAAAVEELNVQESGSHLIVLETKDARGQLVKSSASVWAIGSGNSYWATDENTRMGLIPNKRSFAPGETAVLVPETSVDGGTMLVTVERSGILEARIERGVGTPGLQIPLSEAHAPNVFVSVALVRGRTGPKDSERPSMKLGMVSLPVTFKARALNVQISTEGTDFEPGQTVRGKVKVLGQDGAPVRAEVALSAADEGVLQLIGYQTPNPMDSFYEPWGLGVRSATNWNRVAKLHDVPEDTVEDGEGGADSAGSDSGRVRSRFVASAFWAPALVTDAQGEAAFSFETPDNLTAFRLMAAVADVGSRFGSSEQRIRVRKDLLIAPIVPRFLLADDEIELGAVVHNYTPNTVEVETRFEIEGAVPKKTTLHSKIESNGKAVLHVPVKVQTGALAVFKAETSLVNPVPGQKPAHDALKLDLPVERAVVKDAETLFAGRGTSAQAALEWHKGIDPQASLLEVAVDRTGVADLGPSLKYLVQYPYGCLEQTLSGLIPLLKVRELGKSLGLKELKDTQLERFIEAGVAKVIRHQRPDGQFSLWPDEKAYPHLTVYALWGLNEAKRGGVRVDKRALELGLAAVRTWANESTRSFAPSDESGTLAMAAYVMAELGEPDAALNARLFAAKNALPVYGKAYLLRALRKAKAPAGDQQLLLEDINKSVRVAGESATVDDPIAPDSYYFSSESRSMALVLTTLLEAQPDSALIAPLVLGLKKRRVGGRWESTQENVYGLLALAAYARVQSTGKAKLSVRAGDQVLSDTTLSGGALATVRLPLTKLTRGAVLKLESSEPVFYNAVLYKVRPEPVAAQLDHGFGVQREYLALETGKPVSSVKVGDLVKVRVHLSTPEGRRYVAVSDPLPSGFEAVNSRLKTERDVSSEEEAGDDDGDDDGSDGDDYYNYGWFWDYRALRDERTDWFIDSLSRGQKHIDYVVRATHVGTFTVPPARAEEMYRESVMGHSQSHVLKVTR